MQVIPLISLVSIAAVNTLMATLLMIRTYKQRSSSFYFAVSASLITPWAIGDALLLFARSPVLAHVGAILFFVAPMFTVLYLVYFAYGFPIGRRIPKSLKYALALLTIALAAIITAQPSIVLENIFIAGSGQNTLNISMPGYLAYTAFFMSFFLMSYVALLRNFLASSGIKRNQVSYSAVGIVATSLSAAVTNLFFPMLAGSSYVWLGPVFSMFYISTTTLAIVKHRLFDIRLVVARTLAYVLLLGTIAVVYGLIVFTIPSRFFDATEITLAQQLFYVLAAVFLAFTFQPLRRFFEKATDRIFYRDKYDSQVVLNQISRVLAQQIDIQVITREVLKVIGRNLKLRGASFAVVDKGKIYRIEEYGAVAKARLDIEQLKRLEHNIILVDELEENPLKQMLQDHNIAVTLRLKTQGGVVGYLLLGPKESGGVFINQDVELLEILSNELAVAVENARSFEKIADFNVTLQERIKEATAKLRAQNVKLKELDRAKDEFISMASHQLRTPLTTIKGYLSMMLEGDAGKLKGEQHKFTDAAFMSAQRMVYLISDMLNVSRISTGRLTFDMKPLDLAEITKEEIAQLKRTANAKNVTLHFNPPKEKIPKLSLDEGKVRQVMMNFMDNAIYYAPDTTVEVYLEQEGDKVRFLVKDKGIGVPKKAQGELFSKFFRAENARQSRPDGTGLGLYMAKMVIEAMGGEIVFKSTPGKGSTFGFEYSIKKTQQEGPTSATKPKPKSKSKSKK